MKLPFRSMKSVDVPEFYDSLENYENICVNDEAFKFSISHFILDDLSDEDEEEIIRYVACLIYNAYKINDTILNDDYKGGCKN